MREQEQTLEDDWARETSRKSQPRNEAQVVRIQAAYRGFSVRSKQVMTDCSNISFTSDALHTKWPIGIPAPRVWIYPNDGGISATPEPVIVDGSLAQLLLFAAEILNDDTVQISHFTTTRGLRVRRVDQLKNNMELTAIPVDHKFVARVPQYGPAASSGGSSTRRSAAPSSTRSAAADWDGGGAGSVGREGWDSFSKSTLFGGSIKPLNSNWQHSDLQETGGLRECAGIDTPADGRWTASTGVLPEEWSTASTKRPRVVLHKNDGLLHSEGAPTTLVYTLQALLEEAAEMLNLRKAARRIFTMDGEEVGSIREIYDMQELVISTGDKFSELCRRWPDGVRCPKVHLYRNDGGSGPEEPMGTVQVYTLGALLTAARTLLQLPRRARRLFIIEDPFAQTATEVKQLGQIKHNALVVVSQGPPFVDRSGQDQTICASVTPRRPPHSVGAAHGYSRASSYKPRAVKAAVKSGRRSAVCTESPKRWPAGVTRPRVLLYRNDGGSSQQCTQCLVHTYRTLLEHATLELGMSRAASRLFLMDGREVASVDQLRNHLELVASGGEAFKPRHNLDPHTKQTTRGANSWMFDQSSI